MDIKKLTPEQAAMAPGWVKKWIDIGLSCERMNADLAKDAVRRAYDACGLPQPIVVATVGSPYAAMIAGPHLLASLRQIFKAPGAPDVDTSPAAMLEQVKEGMNNYFGGAFYASRGAQISFIRDVIGWDAEHLEKFKVYLEKFKIDEDLILSCGWVWWHGAVCVISDRPEQINLDPEGNVHSLTGPSISYRDGWSLYHVHGTAIPAEWITVPGHLTAEMALTWENVEQRRAACVILGWDTILKSLDAKSLDVDSDPQIGELLEVTLPGSGKERFLRVTCATGRVFALPVPPTMTTALEANAWGYDIPVDLLKNKETRT